MLRSICCAFFVLALVASVLINPNSGNPGAAAPSIPPAFDVSKLALDKLLTKLSPNVLAAQTTKRCGNLTSVGNPYGCCNGSNGNCTFAAWEMAKRYWNGHQMPGWSGNAKAWLDDGRAPTAGYPIEWGNANPPLFSIAVSKTLSSFGHVGLVKAVYGSRIVLEDQDCFKTDGLREREYNLGSFAGFIKNKATTSQSLLVYGMSPGTLYSGGTNQQVLFSVGNIQGNLHAIVTFPNGGRATLTPSQQIWVYGFQTVGTRMVLGTPGLYKIQFFNTTGVHSQPYSFWVN